MKLIFVIFGDCPCKHDKLSPSISHCCRYSSIYFPFILYLPPSSYLFLAHYIINYVPFLIVSRLIIHLSVVVLHSRSLFLFSLIFFYCSSYFLSLSPIWRSFFCFFVFPFFPSPSSSLSLYHSFFFQAFNFSSLFFHMSLTVLLSFLLFF